MKKIGIIVFGLMLFSCSSPTEENMEKEAMQEELNMETKKQLEEVEEANVELEKLDGELDSLLNTI